LRKVARLLLVIFRFRLHQPQRNWVRCHIVREKGNTLSADMAMAGCHETVLQANTPVEAIRLAKEHVGEIRLLITDVIMPEMNGKDLASTLLSLYPQLKCLFMSGYTADAIAHHGVLDEGVYFIQKPFSLSALATKVRNVLEHNEQCVERR